MAKILGDLGKASSEDRQEALKELLLHMEESEIDQVLTDLENDDFSKLHSAVNAESERRD